MTDDLRCACCAPGYMHAARKPTNEGKYDDGRA